MDEPVGTTTVRTPRGSGAVDETTARPRRVVRRVSDRFDKPGRRGAGAAAVGRYVLLDRIGAGGMGQVFAAYDPELDRKVAVKLVLAVGSEFAVRLLREAQALARLAHPDPIAVALRYLSTILRHGSE